MCDGIFGWNRNGAGVSEEDRVLIRRCQRGLGGLIALHAALFLTLQHYQTPGLERAICAGLEGAVLFAMFLILATIGWRRTRNGTRRAITVEAFGWGMSLTLLFALVWGCVETFGPSTTTHVPLIVVPALVLMLSAAAKAVLLLRAKWRPGLMAD